MPSSDHATISPIMDIIRRVNPKVVLDIGIGCGKYGMLIREYLDGHWMGRAFHDKATWKTTIIGVEICEKYITPMHKFLYDEILICDAYGYFTGHNTLGTFDLILMGDVIEHFPKDHGIQLIQALRDRWTHQGSHLVISTPNFQTQINNESLAVFGNKHEVHRCRWTAEEFLSFGMHVTANVGRHIVMDMERL